MIAGSVDRHTITTSDGVMLAVSSAGDGDAIAFVHEFSGDLRSWTPQFADLQAGYRCIAFNARGYPPSDVPASLSAYSQERAADDVAETLRALGVGKAHLVGLSMGGFAVLHTAIRHPALVASLVVAGCGYGAKPSEQDAYHAAMNREAGHAEEIGMRGLRREIGRCPAAPSCSRAKDGRAWKLFVEAARGAFRWRHGEDLARRARSSAVAVASQTAVVEDVLPGAARRRR